MSGRRFLHGNTTKDHLKMKSNKDAYAEKPLIYSCSGCSSAAQLANHLAIRMDRQQTAEMSCIVGLGGNVKPLLRTALAGRPIAMLDGCPRQCGRHTLKRHGIVPELHWDLSRKGIAKRKHEDFDPQDAQRLAPELAEKLKEIAEATPPKLS